MICRNRTYSSLHIPAAGKGAGVNGRFLPDEEVTYEDLIYGALLPSGADACMTLAISLYGSEDAFVAEMNAQAEN